jgi:uncharacterized protein
MRTRRHPARTEDHALLGVPPDPMPRRTAAAARSPLVRRQVTVFVLVTMALSWVFIPVTGGDLLPYGPMLAAFLVLSIVSGRRGVAELWAQMTRWRVGPRWYVVAAGIFVGMHAAALGLAATAGVVTVDTGALSWGALVAVLVPLVFVGGQWEEPGWLGHLVRRLRDARVNSPLLVLLVAGSIRMVWHTPLVLLGVIPWYDYVFGTFALQVILLWLYDRTGGSVLVPMVGHLFSNLTLATVFLLVAEPDRWHYWLVFVVLEVVVAVGILLATRGRLGLPAAGVPDRQQE